MKSKISWGVEIASQHEEKCLPYRNTPKGVLVYNARMMDRDDDGR